MDIEYAAIVRASVGVLYALLGLFLIVRAPRSKTMAVWGAVYFITGSMRIHGNLLVILSDKTLLSTLDILISVLFDLVLLALLVALLVFAARPLPRTSVRAVRAVFLSGFAIALAYVIFDSGPFREIPVRQMALIANKAVDTSVVFAAGALWIAILEGLRRQSMPKAKSWLLAAFPIVGTIVGGNVASQMDWLFPEFVVFITDLPPIAALDALTAVVALVPLAWCYALLGGPNGRFVCNLLLGIFVWIAFSLAYVRTAPEFDGFFGTAPGILRVIALATIGYAIVARDFLPTALRLPTARRGTLAGVALASLIITAQIAQNFLGAKYGIYVGGLVAGGVLVAAFPLQRRLERVAGSRNRNEADSERSFVQAARIALRDRVLTTQEGLDLLDLAFQLGIPPRRATALIDQERSSQQGGRRQLGLDAETTVVIDEGEAGRHVSSSRKKPA
ncbi:MAG: hypothetical protein WC876_01090 [Candidatus Thermoplasmatota archaeon]|jgi:hypothetical protein